MKLTRVLLIMLAFLLAFGMLSVTVLAESEDIEGSGQLTGGDGAPGVGTGAYASSGNISILGGTIHATGDFGAGIGGGTVTMFSGSILIAGGEVHATSTVVNKQASSDAPGAGIGSGSDAAFGDEAVIRITGGTVFAGRVRSLCAERNL